MKKIIINTLIIFGLCFITHFAYDVVPSFITSVFAPVNESIFEHFKMLFMTCLFYEIIRGFIKKDDNIFLISFLTAITSTIILTIIYLPTYSLIGENMPVTIFILLLSILLGQIIKSKLDNKKHYNSLNLLSVFAIVISIVVFTFLTYNPPHTKLFYDTKDKIYGLNK